MQENLIKSIPAHLWLNRTDAASLIDVTPRWFDESIRPLLPPDAIRGNRQSLRFHGPAVVGTWDAARMAKLERDSGDPLAGSTTPDSPALERYRVASADLAELQRDRTRAGLVRIDEIEPALMQLAPILRRAGDVLTRRFGVEAGALINEGANEWSGGLGRLLQNLKAKGEETAGAGEHKSK